MDKDPMLQEILHALKLHGEHIDSRFEDMENRFEKRFEKIDRKFEGMDRRFDDITVRLDRIEKKQDIQQIEIADAHEKINFVTRTVSKHDDILRNMQN